MMNAQMVKRVGLIEELRTALQEYPVVSIFGPRQCGKSTLVKPFAESEEHYYVLDSLMDRTRLEESGYLVLDHLKGTVVIDEAQHSPALFPKLRVLADRTPNPAKFILTGSASPALFHNVSESLTGRTHLMNLGGFTAIETGVEKYFDLWLRGGFPKSFLSPSAESSMRWRKNYLDSVIGRDIPLLIDSRLPQQKLMKLVQLTAANHGCFWNHSAAATIIGGLTYKTVQRYIDLLLGTYFLRELPAYHANATKRLRKSPKLYLRDSGLLHLLNKVRSREDMLVSGTGASWEGFCVEQIIRMTGAGDQECFTWSIERGPEVDLLLDLPSGVFGFECKATASPSLTPSMSAAVAALPAMKRLFVIYPGDKTYTLGEKQHGNKIQAVGFEKIHAMIQETVPDRL